MNHPKITPPLFDAMVHPKPKPERLIGAPAIAKALGMSEDTVIRLAATEGVPIYKPPGLGRYYAFRSELEAWLRTKPAA